MAAAGDTASKQIFKLPSKIQVTVTKDDIFSTPAVAITTGEDERILGQGGVSKELLKRCPDTYNKAREDMKKMHKRFELGNVYSCRVDPRSKGSGQKMAFNIVYHAVVPSTSAFHGLSSATKWKDKMKELYDNLFQKVNCDGNSSLALPLLGSGGAGASFDQAVEPLVLALVNFQPKPILRLQDITVYIRDDKAFTKLVSRMDKECKHLPATTSTGDKGKSQPSSQTRVKKISSASKQRFRKSSKPTEQRYSEDESNLAIILADSTSGDQDSGQNKDIKCTDLSSSEKDSSNLHAIFGSKLAHARPMADPSQRKYSDTKDDSVGVDEDGYGIAESEGQDNGCESQESDDEPFEVRKDAEDENEEDDSCPICLDVIGTPKKLEKCGHVFCTGCIEDSFRHHKPACPTCNTLYGIIIGNQPPGTMIVSRGHQSLPGYKNCGILIINYNFSSGIQGKEHPNPGQPYAGTHRMAFLPDNSEGVKVCRLLRIAFDNRLTFTVGRSRTTGAENVVTWNDIHHKTNIDGGPTRFGYPDPQYLSRVQEELAARGVTEECLKDENWKRHFDV